VIAEERLAQELISWPTLFDPSCSRDRMTSTSYQSQTWKFLDGDTTNVRTMSSPKLPLVSFVSSKGVTLFAAFS
jgi:hypothetical protein